MKQTYPVTKNGANILEEELKVLKTERFKVIEAIAEARSHGDLSENAEYDAAKNRQGLVEAKIAEIERKLSMAQIIDITNIANTGKVIFASYVLLLDLSNDKQVCYQIVSDDEANLAMGRISVNSPVARGLIGKHIGDVAEIVTPSGNKEYEIIAVDYNKPPIQ